MDYRSALNNLKVEDVWNLVQTEPDTVDADEPLIELLERVATGRRQDTVYVVTKSGRLCGTVSARALVASLFPMQAIEQKVGKEMHYHFGASTVREIMNLKPRYVTRETSLVEMARIMLREKVNELPVVDERMRLRGEVDIRELFTGYLRIRRLAQDAETTSTPGADD